MAPFRSCIAVMELPNVVIAGPCRCPVGEQFLVARRVPTLSRHRCMVRSTFRLWRRSSQTGERSGEVRSEYAAGMPARRGERCSWGRCCWQPRSPRARSLLRKRRREAREVSQHPGVALRSPPVARSRPRPTTVQPRRRRAPPVSARRVWATTRRRPTGRPRPVRSRRTPRRPHRRRSVSTPVCPRPGRRRRRPSRRVGSPSATPDGSRPTRRSRSDRRTAWPP